MVELILLVPAAIVAFAFVYFLFRKPEKENGAVNAYLLHDNNFKRNDDGTFKDIRTERWPVRHYLGHAMLFGPREAQTRIDFTSPPGACAGLYYSLMFQLGKWEYRLQKFDEVIEVAPVHGAYYQVTLKQKEDLEGRIKAGLTSAAQAVADLELLKHDERRYREFLDYFGHTWNSGKNDFTFDKAKRDEHALKSMFIDLIDVHTGEGISMKSIVQRWPTLIVDFQKVVDEDTDIDKLKNRLDISKAEAVVLVTKNRLYTEWKRLFEPQLKERYRRISELIRSREKSVEQYRDWLKPVIARHRLINDSMVTSGSYRSLFIPAGGQATAVSNVTIWVWRDVSINEPQKGGTERLAIETAEKKVDPLDDWTLKNLVFHPKHGLVVEYPWITKEWVAKQKEAILAAHPSTPPGVWMPRHKLYYSFIIINFERVNIRLASGAELEDLVFDVNGLCVSQNVLMVKLLELKAKESEFERYLDDLLGVGKPVEGTKPEFKERKLRERVHAFLNYFSIGMSFFKHGPYERDFEQRITKIVLLSMSINRYQPIVNFIKQKMGMGE